MAGKKFKKAVESCDRDEALHGRRGLRAPAEDCKISAKFDETVDVADPPRRRTRSTPTRWSAARSCCPHGTGKTERVLVFAKGDKAKEAQEAGADFVGAEDSSRRSPRRTGSTSTRVVATPDMMGRSVGSAASSVPAA